MTLVFAAVAAALIVVGGLATAIDAAYGSLSRSEVAEIGEGTRRAKTFDAIAAALARVRSIILDRERHTEWVKHAVE